MSKYQNAHPFQPDFWLPVALLLLPVIMMLMPLVIYIEQNRALYYTPLLVKAFLMAVVLFAALTGASRGQGGSGNRMAMGLLMLLLAIILLTTLFRANNIAYSAEKLVDLGLIAALAYFVKNMFERSGEKLIEASLWAIFGSIIIAVPIMAILFHYRIPQHDLWPNFLPGFVHIRIYGFSLTVAIAIGTGLLAKTYPDHKYAKPLIFAGLLLLWTTLFWSGSRGGIAALVLVFPVMFLLVRQSRKAILSGLIPLVLGAALSTQLVVETEAFGVFNSFEDTFKATSVDRISSGRIHEWRFVLEKISDKPVFGYGFGQRGHIGAENAPDRVHVHNIVLEVALAWGWLGAIIAAILIAAAWVGGLKKIRNAKIAEYVPAFLVINVLMVYAWVDGVYMYYQATIPFAICVAVLWARFDKADQKA